MNRQRRRNATPRGQGTRSLPYVMIALFVLAGAFLVISPLSSPTGFFGIAPVETSDSPPETAESPSDASELTPLLIPLDGTASTEESTQPSSPGDEVTGEASAETAGFGTEGFSIASTSISECGNLSGYDETYTLSTSVSSTGTCFTIEANNVTLDCLGRRITYDSSGGGGVHGVVASSRENVTVKECVIMDGSDGGGSSNAITFASTNRGVILNNTLIPDGDSAVNYGINLDSSLNISVRGNIIRNNGTSTSNKGIYQTGGSGFSFVNNSITTNASEGNNGIHVVSGYHYNITDNDIHATDVTGSGNNGIFIESFASDARILRNTITTYSSSGATGIRAATTDAVNITDNVIKVLINETGSGSGKGIILTSISEGHDFVINNNTINVSSVGTSNYGISVASSVHGELRGNSVAITGASGNAGLLLNTASNFSTSNNTFSVQGTADMNYGVFFETTVNNVTFVNTTIDVNGTTAVYGVYLTGAPITNISFLNTNVSAGGTAGSAIELGFETSKFSFNNTVVTTTTDWIVAEVDVAVNFTNTTFATTNGSIRFPNRFNITGTSDVTLALLEPSFNKAFLNATVLDFLNASAFITLNNLTFTNAQPMVDFEGGGTNVTCPEDVCTEVSYSGNTFLFNVSHWTSFSAAETAADQTVCQSIGAGVFLMNNSVNTTGPSCFNFSVNHATLDCNGYSITGNRGSNQHGINASSRLNVTVRNCIITNFSDGIFFTRVRQGTIFNNSFINNSDDGIDLGNNNFTVISHNMLTNNTDNGIEMSGWFNNITNNTIVNTRGDVTSHGLQTFRGSSIIPGSGPASLRIINNTFIDNQNDGINTAWLNDSVIANNTLTGNGDDSIVLWNATAIEVTGNNVGRSGDDGITMDGTNYSFVAFNNISETSGQNIDVIQSHNNNFTNNTLFYGSLDVLRIRHGSSNNTFWNTTIWSNNSWYTSNNSIENNNFTNTTFANSNGSIRLSFFQANITQEVNTTVLNISNNRAYLNATNLSNMNVSAVIILNTTGLSFTTPEIGVDYGDTLTYVTCPASKCNTSTTGGSLYRFNVSHWTSFRVQESVVALACGDTITTSQTLTADVTATGTCFVLAADNIMLNCDGFTITYDTAGAGANGVSVLDNDNVTVKNCFIQDATMAGASSVAVNLTRSNDSLVFNNTLIVNGTTTNYGVLIQTGSYRNTIANNTIRTIAGTSTNYGIFLTGTTTTNSVQNNNLSYNNITVNGTSSIMGIRLELNAHNTTIHHNNISVNTTLTTSNNGIFLTAASGGGVRHNNITNNDIRLRTGGTSAGIGVNTNADWNLIANNTVNATGTSTSMIGIDVFTSVNDTVTGNNVTVFASSTVIGIRASSTAHNNKITENRINVNGTGGNSYGIRISSTAFGNNATNNWVRSDGTGTNIGILVDTTATNTTVQNNTIYADGSSSGNLGIQLVTTSVVGTRIAYNTIRVNGTGGNNHGIDITVSDNTTIENNTIYTNGPTPGATQSSNFGILVSGSTTARTNITGNKIFTNGTGLNVGVRMDSSAFQATIENNTIVTGGNETNNHGISFNSLNIRNNITGNLIITNGRDSNHALFFASSDNNTARYNNFSVNSNKSRGIYFLNSNNTNVSHNTFNGYTYINSSDNTVNNFTNTTFETPNATVRFVNLFQLNGSIDINSSVLNLTFNRALLNATNLTMLNTSAFITFSGLTFTNAQAVVDYTDTDTFSTCPEDVCTNTSYAGGVFRFNVSHWTTFGSQEFAIANSTNMQLTKRDTLNPVAAGTSLTFNVTINNTGTDTAYNVTLTETYNANVTFGSGQPVPVGVNNDTFIIGNLTTGQVYVMNVTVTVNGTVFNGSLINNTVNISWFNTSGVFNTLNTTINTTVTGDLKADACQTLALPGTYRVSQNLSVFGNFSTCFNLTTNDINLNCDGFTLRGNRSEGQHGINASALNNLTVQNCVITNFTDGLVFSRVRNAIIYNNTALNNSDDGFDIRSTNTSVISFNNASRNFDTNILLAGGWYNNFTNNTVDNARGDVYSNGFTVTSNSKENRFVNNTALSNQNSGILITQSDNNSVLNNTAFANGEDGIVFNQSLTNVMRSNLVRNNSDDGIVVDTSNFSVIDMNNASRNGDNNIILFQSNNNNVTNNTASLAAGAGFNNGIAVSNISNSNRIINNTMADNSDDGLQLIRSNDSVVAFNRVINNGDDGIDISNDTGHNISFNYIQGNFLGIALTPGFGIWIENNTITNNTNDGIFIARHSENSTIIRNLITDHLASGGAGINLYTNNSPNHNITIIHNIINGTGDHGIVVLNLSQNISVVNNTIRFAGMSNPSGSGIYARDVKNLNITGNNISNASDTGIWVNMIENLTIAFNNISGINVTFIRVNITNSTLLRANTLQNTNLTSLQLLNAANTTLLDSPFKNYTLTSSGITIRTSGIGQIEFDNRSMTVTGINFTNETSLTTNNLTVRNLAFNTSANLTLNGLSFTNAVAIIDVDDDGTYLNCTTDVCTNTSYDGSTFKFNVSHWTTFAAEEAAVEGAAANSTCSDIAQNTVLNASVNSTGTCFNITNDNLTLNCNGHTITYDLAGTGNVSGVTAMNKVNITVRNCIIRDGNASGSFGMAINLTGTNNSLILNNSITTNGTNQSIGIMIAGTSRYDRIEDNRITTLGADRNNFGIWMVDERDSNVTSNIISTNGTHQNHGIKIETGTNITVRNNTIAARGTANQSTGITLSSSTTNSTVESNAITTDGERANYGVDLTLVGGYNRVLRNAINTSGTSDINVGVHVSTSSNQTIDSNVIRTNGTHDNYGIRLEVNIFETNATNNTIVTNGTAGSNHGFLIQSGASRNLIAENTITTSGVTNDNRGIALILSALNNTLRGNVIVTGPRTSYNQHGITSQSDSMNNQIINNTITVNGENATYGIRLNDVANITIINNTLRVNGTASNAGIRAVNTNQSVILHNFIRVFGNQSQGIDLHNSSDNTFTNTNITAQGIDALGFYLEGSNGTQVSTLILDNPSNWLIANVSTFNNFTNTTFSTGNGSVQFPDLISLNGSLLLNRSALDITLNRSFSNSSNHSAFNRSANIVLSGLGFTNAQAVVDDTDTNTYSTCPEDVCTNTSYDGSTFKFNVSHWTTFAAQEYITPPVYNSTNISVSKGDDVDPVNISTLLTYHINITSTGTGMTYNITLNESYPAEVRFQNATPSPVSGTNHSFLIGNLSNGSVFRLNITVLTLNSTNGTVINNTANVSFVNETGFRTNVTDTENTTVENISVAPAPAPEPSPTPSASGGGGGGGGGGGCVDVCDIGESICTSSGRSVCAKTGVCTAYVPSPCASGETCSKGSCNPCEESWLCDDWSACDGGVKTRTCADLNGCSTTKLEPETERACESPISLISLPAPIVKMLETFKAVPWEKPIIIITLMIAAITMLLALILEHELRKRYLKAHWVYFVEAGILVGLNYIVTAPEMFALRVLMLVFAVSFAALFLKEAIKQTRIMAKAQLAQKLPTFTPLSRKPTLFQHLGGIITQKRKASHEEILTTRTKLEELNQSLKELKLQLKRKK